jgi:multisubunit Na+/H+ antiporter MnhB subunit
MVDVLQGVSISTEQIGQNTAQATSQAGLLFMLVLCGLIIVSILGFFLYRRKFNIDIIHIPSNGQPVLTGLKGRDYFTGKGKEYRFKIWRAKSHKIKYSEESVKPADITVHKLVNGKLRRLMWTSTDSNGNLVPIKVSPELMSYEIKRIDDKGVEQTEVVKTTVLRSKYSDVDVSWLQMGRDKWAHIFKNEDKMIFWGLIIVGLIMLLALGSFLWGVNKNAEIATTNQEIAGEQAKSNALLVETLCIITEKCANSTGTTTPFNSIIST